MFTVLPSVRHTPSVALRAGLCGLGHSPVSFCRGSPAVLRSLGSQRPQGRSCVVPGHSPAPSHPANERDAQLWTVNNFSSLLGTERFREDWSQEFSVSGNFALWDEEGRGRDGCWLEEGCAVA